ncbi:MAG TPA: aspartate aminotransferase family protein, partial [Candidatus Acidoferrum sp.]|nr:aspartate aminotransferase family protein [Candidatus Acidoferrum sp.]
MSTPATSSRKYINRSRLQPLLERESQAFIDAHPKSAALYGRAQQSLLGGVPMNWMKKWAGKFPVFVSEARGAHFTDVDGHDYIDFCLGDTGAMTGHSPAPAAEAIARQSQQGITLMLPTEDACWVGEELTRRFSLPFWQFTLTATDANRFSIRIAREITGRSKILVFNYCYHGSVDESFITLHHGVAGPRRGNVGPPVNPSLTTRVVEFNDLAALEAALAHTDVACILAEPVMTNVGIVLPEHGFWQAAQELAQLHATLLILDETHTLCCSPGGYTQEHHLHPDMLVVGKPIAGGLPAGAYGCSAEVAQKISSRIQLEDCDTGGIGGTLAGNALSLAAMRATLENVLTPAAFARMIPLAERWAHGVASAITSAGLPWHVSRLGCRAEYHFQPAPPRNGGEAAASMDFDLERFLHLYALNRGILLTPFHNMALMSPATTAADVDRHTEVFSEA